MKSHSFCHLCRVCLVTTPARIQISTARPALLLSLCPWPSSGCSPAEHRLTSWEDGQAPWPGPQPFLVLAGSQGTLPDATHLPSPQLSSSHLAVHPLGWTGDPRFFQLPRCGSRGCLLLPPCLYPGCAAASALSPLHSSAC